MWVIYSLIAALGFGCISLLLSYLSKAHISPIIVNTWFWGITALLFLSTALLTSRNQLKIQQTHIKWFLLLAVVAFITNYFSVKAFAAGPNAGIVRSLQISQIAVAAIGGYFIFHTSLGPKAGIGMAFLATGLILIISK